jgi:hypothetical protein
MLAQMRGALGEQNTGHGAGGESDQHRGFGERAGAGQVYAVIRRARGVGRLRIGTGQPRTQPVQVKNMRERVRRVGFSPPPSRGT